MKKDTMTIDQCSRLPQLRLLVKSSRQKLAAKVVKNDDNKNIYIFIFLYLNIYIFIAKRSTMFQKRLV